MDIREETYKIDDESALLLMSYVVAAKDGGRVEIAEGLKVVISNQ